MTYLLNADMLLIINPGNDSCFDSILLPAQISQNQISFTSISYNPPRPLPPRLTSFQIVVLQLSLQNLNILHKEEASLIALFPCKEEAYIFSKTLFYYSRGNRKNTSPKTFIRRLFETLPPFNKAISQLILYIFQVFPTTHNPTPFN